VDLRHLDDPDGVVEDRHQSLGPDERGGLVQRLRTDGQHGGVVHRRPGGEPVEQGAHVGGATGQVGELLLDAHQVRLGPGEDGVRRGLVVQGVPQLGGVALLAQAWVAVGVRQRGLQPADVLGDRLGRGGPRRLDLAAQGRFGLESTLDLGREQVERALELGDGRLDVDGGHAAHRSPGGGEGLRDGGQPTGQAVQPVGQRGEVAGEQQVEGGAGVGEQRVPGVLAQFVEREEPLGELRAQDLQVDLVRDVEDRVVDAVQQAQVPLERAARLGQTRLGSVGKPAVVPVVTEPGGLDRVQLEQVVQRRGRNGHPPLLHEGALLCVLPQ
jgi:hypothetical protein